jgi:hypothetical protein
MDFDNFHIVVFHLDFDNFHVIDIHLDLNDFCAALFIGVVNLSDDL